MIVIVDFGGQTAHLISRRIRELGVLVKMVYPEKALNEIQNVRPQGIILSGGPASVYEKNAPTIDKKIFSLGIPILGICYGLQTLAHVLDGKVVSGNKEYGPATIQITNNKLPITRELPQQFTVWMSHGDEVVAIPKGFETIGSTSDYHHAFIADTTKRLYGVQFHPEVEHTQYGTQLLKNFIGVCSLTPGEHIFNLAEMEKQIKDLVKDAYVIGAVSGGIDSTVAAVLTAKAIGSHFIPIYVDNGLMRIGTSEHVGKIFSHIGIKADIVKAEEELLQRLKGVSDPERKRKVIGAHFIEVFEREMEKLISEGKNVTHLMQGTIFSDVIESKGSKHADKIKSHHNVGGLPEKMKLKLLEPLRDYYKDEVREIGKLLGLPDEFVHKQKFPGPGYGIRIRGEVTKERLEKEKQADGIVLEELEKAGWLEKVFHSFPVMTGAYSTSVKGDGRFFGEVVALRVTVSSDEMTSNWAHLPYEVLQKISSRIVNEVPGISRVVYDISTKPPATMEWE